MLIENQYFNEIKFYKRSDNDYWYSTTTINGKRVYMHKYVWEFYNSPIPRGYEVHHIDLNRDNNEISNLRLMRRVDHQKLHTELNRQNPDWIKAQSERIKKAQEKAKEWHKSEEGRKWHREHAKSIDWSKINFGESTCIMCKKTYIVKRKGQKFCCPACKAKFYRRVKKLHMIDNAIM